MGLHELRSFHTKAEILVQKFLHKDDLTLYQWRLHTAAQTFVHHTKFGSG